MLQYPLTDAEKNEIVDWQEMHTFPRDGTRCVIKFKHGSAWPGWRWGRSSIGIESFIRGDEAVMSSWLEPVGWVRQERDYRR